MAVLESPGALLRRAADRLDELDKAATPGDWNGFSDCPADQPRGTIYAGPRDDHGYRTGMVCSWSEDDENGMVMSQADMNLICALRDITEPLALWLRMAAGVLDANLGIVEPPAWMDWMDEAISTASVVLGETGDGEGR